jgi:hypothetical protein
MFSSLRTVGHMGLHVGNVSLHLGILAHAHCLEKRFDLLHAQTLTFTVLEHQVRVWPNRGSKPTRQVALQAPGDTFHPAESTRVQQVNLSLVVASLKVHQVLDVIGRNAK